MGEKTSLFVHVVTNGETMLEIADPETSQMSNGDTKPTKTWQQSEQLKSPGAG